eukprot:IDg4792t1
MYCSSKKHRRSVSGCVYGGRDASGGGISMFREMRSGALGGMFDVVRERVLRASRSRALCVTILWKYVGSARAMRGQGRREQENRKKNLVPTYEIVAVQIVAWWS